MGLLQNFIIFSFLFVSLAHCQDVKAATCYYCDGEECLRTSFVGKTKTCTADEHCVALFDGYSPIKKGCYSDLTVEQKLICDTVSDISCYTCATANCNNLGRSDHKCLQCSSETDKNCLDDPTKIADTRCEIPRTDDVYCYVNVASNITLRGCISNAPETLVCTNSAKCSLCSVSRDGSCNTYTFPENRRKCVHCYGDDCASVTNTTAVISKYCPWDDDSCMAINHSGTFKQFCTKDISTVEKEYCAANLQSCTTCDTDNCNIVLPPNFGISLLVNRKILLLTLVLGYFYL